MDWDRPLAPWDEVVEALSAYDANAIERYATAAAQRALDEAYPAPRRAVAAWAKARASGLAGKEPAWARGFAERLRGELSGGLGEYLRPWYGARGWVIGNESFGGCLCHGPLNALLGDAGVAEPARVGAWVRGEVDAMVGCLRAFEPRIAAAVAPAPDARRRLEALERVVAGMMDDVVERTRCSESWYNYVNDAVEWLARAAGLLDDAALAALVGSMEGVFSSWTDPGADARRAVAVRVAFAIDAGAEREG